MGITELDKEELVVLTLLPKRSDDRVQSRAAAERMCRWSRAGGLEVPQWKGPEAHQGEYEYCLRWRYGWYGGENENQMRLSM